MKDTCEVIMLDVIKVRYREENGKWHPENGSQLLAKGKLTPEMIKEFLNSEITEPPK